MFTFKKQTAVSWSHFDGTQEVFFGDGIPVINITANTIIFQTPNGTNFPKQEISILNANIIDESGGGEVEYTFTTANAFKQKLIDLNYPYINQGVAGVTPNLQEVLMIGGREKVVLEVLTYEFAGANKGQYLVFAGNGTDDVAITLNTYEFNDGDSIVGYNGTATFNLIIDNSDGFIIPDSASTITIPPYYTFVITRIDAITYSLCVLPYDISGGGATNLGYTASPTNGIVTSSTGTDATIPLANGTNAGLSENNVADGEKSFLATASGKDLDDYAKLDTTALENYTTTTDLNTLLGAKADVDSTFELIFHGASTNVADNAVMYMGGSNNLPPSTTNNRFEVAGITSSKLRATIYIYNTGTLGSAEDLSITLMNVTQTTEISLTTTAKTNSTSYNLATNQLNFAITKGDNLAIRLNATTIATNPTNVLFGVRVMQIK